MKNIVLIGMPGSGKSSVGLVLARQLVRPLLDTDSMVEAAAGRAIPDIFADAGEALFRSLESAAALEAAQCQGVIISTGGGMVLRAENMAALKKNGVIFFLDRPPEVLAEMDRAGRPLLAGGEARVHELYAQRIDRYRAYADQIIGSSDTAEAAAEEIAFRMEKEWTK